MPIVRKAGRRRPYEIIYHICECGAEIEDPAEELYLDGGVLVCGFCLRESIGLKTTPGANYTFEEIVDALTIERRPAAEWYRRRAVRGKETR